MKKFTYCLLMLYGVVSHAQLMVSNTVETPAQLVQNVLVDASVTPTNIKFNGSAAAANTVNLKAAHFTTNFNGTNLGLLEGILLATGNAQVAIGPNDETNDSDEVLPKYTGDPNLGALTTNVVDNATVLEFDFVATGILLNFDYVFASEEYPEYAPSTFNDVFGFFLSGPNPNSATPYNAMNIALIPNTNIPITINNVHAGNNSMYFVNNGTGTTPAVNTTIQYDGFTTVLKAQADLICGQTYHMKLAIGNVGDNAWDSAVFLKNFRIAPMQLVDDLNLENNLAECPGSTVTLAIPSGSEFVTNPTDYVIEWYVNTTFDPYSAGYPGNYDPTAFTLIPGQNGPTLQVTQTGVYRVKVYTTYGCEVSTDDIEIAFQPNPFVPAPPITICTPNPFPVYQNINQDATIFSGNGSVPAPNPANYIITYYNSTYNDALYGLSNGIIPPGQLSNYEINSASETIYIRLEDLAGQGCVLVMTVPITVGPEPGGTWAYNNMCENSSATPVAPISNTLTPGGTYSATPAGLDIDPVTGAVNPSTSTPGNYTVNYLLPATATCPLFAPPGVPITITAVPAAPNAPTPLTYCQDEVAPALTATGTNLLWYASAAGGTGSATAPVPDTSSSGTRTYYVTQSSNGCESPRRAVVVDINATPVLPTFTAVAPYCQNATATALTATGTGLLWYTAATGGTGSATAPTPSTGTAGTTDYYVTQTINGCESPRVAISVQTIGLPSAPGVTSPIGYCQNDTPAALTATGANLLWYAAATGGVGNAVAPTVNTTSVGNPTFYVSQTVNGCEGPRAAITVNITAIPAAPTVLSPLTYCQNEVVPVLSAGGSGLLWYATPTGGTGNATAPTPSTTASGSTTYYVSQTTGCESPRSAITVNITATPLAPTTTPVVYCQNAPAVALTATGTNLLWYAAATSGTGSATAPIPSTTTSGTTTYYVTQTVSGCESPRAALPVSVTALPSAPAVTALVGYCQGFAAPALSATGSNLLWYAAPTGGTGNATAPTPGTATIGNTTYYVSQTVSGCEGPRAAITVEVYPIPNAPTLAIVQPTCATNTATIAISAPTGINLEYSIDNGVNYQPGTSFAGVAAGATYDVVVRNALTGCVSAVTQAIVNPALAIPAAPTASTTVQPNCITTTGTIVVSAPIGANLEYTINGGISYQAGTTFAGLAPNTSYTISVRDIVNGCTSGNTVVNVNPIPANPAAPTLAITQPICTTPTATILVSAPTGVNLEYSIDGGINYQSSTSFAGLAPNANYSIMVRDVVTGCVSTATVGVVNPIPANPAAPTTTAVQPTCAINTGSFTITAPTGANLQYSNDGGVTYQANTTFAGLVAGTTYNPIVKDILTGCVSAPGTVVINPALNVPVAPTMTVTVQAICSAPTGTIVVSAPTGANLTYSIDGGITFQASTTFAGLLPNTTYNMVVKDNVSGCVSTASTATVNPLPVNPAAPTASATVQPICTTPTGTIVITAPTGANLEYSINGGITYQAGTTFAGLAPNATYNLTVRNTITGCVSASTAVVINPIPANPAAATAVLTQPTCNAPTGAINISSPTGANLEYSINGGTSYQASTSFAALAPNVTYSIIVRNTLTGCVSSPSSFVINIAPTFPATPVATGSNVCLGEQITLGTPAVAGASYSWTGPNGFTSSVQNPVLNNADVSMSGLYSVVISTTADCPSLPGSVAITVNPLPLPVLAQDGYICFNAVTNTGSSYVLNAGLDNATYDFEWFVNNGGSFDPIPLETQNLYTVTVPGTYAVRATNTATGCVSAMVTAPVGMSSPPLNLIAVSSEYFADEQSITITVAPGGVYEYQLDNGAFQIGNVFHNVLPGHHDIKVRNECGELTGTAYLMDYPKFFTPNGDGYYDTWNIFALSGQANAKIYIFDRYGKLLKQISPSGTGWDGTFNGKILPATDYWFTVEYEENAVQKEFKSHFALKR